MSLIEIATCVMLFFACWFAMTPRGQTPHELWTPVASAFAAILFSLGVGATTTELLSILISTAPEVGTAGLVEVTSRVYRPMMLSLAGLGLYVLILRSTIEPPPKSGPSLGGWSSTFMLFSAIAVCGVAFVYHIGLVMESDPKTIRRWMSLTVAMAMFTVGFSAAISIVALGVSTRRRA